MLEDISYLRVFGILLGIILLTYSQLYLRTYYGERKPPLIIGILGIVLLLIGLFPAIANIPAELFSLDAIKGGRLISLLLISVFLLFCGYFWNRYKIAYIRGRFNQLIKNITIQKFYQEYQEAINKNKIDKKVICAVIPALDEEENLPFVLGDMPENIDGHDVKVIVVNDGSKDNTGNVARQFGAYVVDMPFPSGGGLALQCGYMAAISAGASYIVTLDADGQNIPGEIGDVVHPLIEGKCDVVIGSRILGKHEHTSIARTVGVPFFNFLLSMMLGKKITDCASNYRAFTVEVIDTVQLAQEQYHTAEMLIEIAKRGFNIIEVPITFKRRLHGTTKKGGNIVYGAFFLRTILKTWFR